MTIISIAITTRGGKSLFARQYIDITRLRLEGLLSSFPKLLSSSNNYTFLDTENVRFVFHPIEDLYLLLLTTKSTNILSSLSTIKLLTTLFTQTYFPEIPNASIVSDQTNNSKLFELIYSFDEVICPKIGVSEEITKESIEKHLEMESHEERLYEMLRQSKEDDAKMEMKRKVKEIKSFQQENGASFGRMEGFGNTVGADYSVDEPLSSFETELKKKSFEDDFKDFAKKEKKISSLNINIGSKKKTLSLGKKKKKADAELDDLFKEEGIKFTPKETFEAKKDTIKEKAKNSVEFSLLEKLSIVSLSDGSLQNFALKGQVGVVCYDKNKVNFAVDYQSKKQSQIKVLYSPKLDKELLKGSKMKLRSLGSKERSFPVETQFNLVNYKNATSGEESEKLLPLKVVYWPEVNENTVSVSVEVTLNEDLTLNLADIMLKLPLPNLNQGEVEMLSCEIGDWRLDQTEGCLLWQIETLLPETKGLILEFEYTLPEGRSIDENKLFPVDVSWKSKTLICDMNIVSVQGNDGTIDFGISKAMIVEKYEIIQS
eukprot:augustus_masked-scaffold_19-processed-gene-2.40-mRNA-1 protein AED:0.34 eAED:0.34 QI:0/-1/0/1/-1/1/1/0/542